MEWYEKLSDYFPEHEMKHPGQMEDLLCQHPAYHKWESHEVLVTYAEFPNFIFIDYLLVNPNIRGKGMGTKALNAFKRKNKTIILEVEPPDAEKEDTTKRAKFYERNGFHKAEHIAYTRSDEDGEPFSMDVYFWSPNEASERDIMRKMATVCREIHNFKSEKYYGYIVADPEEVLAWEH